MHGRSTRPVVLDLGRLRQIAESITTPLVLHGASGIGATTIADVVELGVAKVNVNADLRAAYLDAVAAHCAGAGSNDDLPGALRAAKKEITLHLVDLISQHTRR